MNEDNVSVNSVKAWILAARPKTLSGAAVPVMIGTSLAARNGSDGNFHLLPAVLCFLFAFIMQIDSNFINDYFDCIKGTDDKETRLGPKRACSEGWITLPAMRIGLIITTLLACVTGLPLILYGGWEMIAVGACCVVFAFLYTTFFSYIGLGDILVLVFFGIVPVCVTYYVILGGEVNDFPITVFLLSVSCGLVIDTLLCINNFRDRHNDAIAGKKTLIVRLGEKNGYKLYSVVGFSGALITIATLCTISHWPNTCLIVILLAVYCILHQITFKKMCNIWEGRQLNKVLGMTARNMFIFGIVTSLAVLLS